jgi:hypothetical protein
MKKDYSSTCAPKMNTLGASKSKSCMHKHSLSLAVMNAIKPILRAPTEPKLLKK